MINKIFKKISNKYSNIFNFLFYLKYLFLIFFLTSLIYLLLPKFFNYEEKQAYIKKNLEQNYNLTVQDIEKIKYKVLPFPNLELSVATFYFHDNNYKISSKKINIFPNILKIYDFQKLQIKKIKFVDSKLILKTKYLTSFYKKLINQKNKIYFKNLFIEIVNVNKSVVSLKKINFSNFGYYKNRINGEVFGKKFKINITEKLDRINFKLSDVGILGEIIFLNNDNIISKIGKFKAKILNSSIKTDFSINKNSLNLKNYIFRNKYLSHKSNGKIIFSPYLSIDLKSSIKDINMRLFYELNLKKILENKEFLKKLNTNQEIEFISKKFSRNLIKKLNLKFSLAYGKIVSTKITYLNEGEIKCENEINLVEDDPVLVFNCIFDIHNKKKFLKNFLLDYKNKNESFVLEIKGNYKLFQKKINFLNVKMNNSYNASQEDLKFFKQSFENILLDENFLDIFNIKKIKQFISEVS